MMRKNFVTFAEGCILRSLLALSLALIVKDVFAQPSADPLGEGATTLNDVIVRGRADTDSRFSSTGSRLTISRQEIESSGAQNVSDVLRLAPGVQVTTTATGGTEIRMRGMGTESTRILIDGVPVGTSSRTTQIPIDQIPADLIEKIEVIRAPTAESQGAAGGTLNIVLKHATARKERFFSLTNQRVWGRDAGLLFFSSSGPLGQSNQSSETGLKTDPNWTYFFSVSAGPRNLGSDTHREFFRTGLAPDQSSTSDEVIRIRNTVTTLTPRFTYRSASDRVVIRGLFSETGQTGRVQSLGDGLSALTPFSFSNQTSFDFERKFSQLGLDWTRSIKGGKLEIRLQGDRSKNEYDLMRDLTTTTATNSTSVLGSFKDNRSESGALGSLKWTFAPADTIWTFGTEYDRRLLAVLSENVANGISTNLDSNSKTLRRAAWGQSEVQIEKWRSTITTGLRVQNYGVETDSAFGPLSYAKTFVQPSANLRSEISESLQFRANIARIVRNPRSWELIAVNQPATVTNGPNSPDFSGNPTLRPEVTLTADIGVDKKLQAGGSTSLNVFARSQKDVIARKVDLNAGRWREQPDNVGDALVWGLEADAKTDLSLLGGPKDWTLNASASLLQSRMSGQGVEGQRIPGQARYLANLSVARPLRITGGWYGGATLAMIGPADLATASGTGLNVSGTEKARSQLDLFIGSVLPSLGYWRLSVFNVTNFSHQWQRSIVDSNGVVYSDRSSRLLTPRWFLTVGTRF
jgi:outer membrane receptor for ferrienterochelin and colicins